MATDDKPVMDIVEFAKKYCGVELSPWQAKLGQQLWDAIERGEDICLHWGCWH